MDGGDDVELLRAYVERGSEQAFRRLVERHSGMVYAACARSLAAADAEDATQAVFILLAKRAVTLTQVRALGGWLYRTSRLVAAEVRRGNMRRMRREQRVATERSGAVDPAPSEADDKLAAQVRPKLDDAIAQLREKQQDAIVLHYLQGKSIRDTAAALECSEDTIKKRIAYGLEKLRAILAHNGIALSVTALVPVLQAEAGRSAPSALLNSCAALSHGAAAGNPALLAKGVSKTMLLLKVKLAAAVAVVLLGAGFSVHALKKGVPPAITRGDKDAPPAPPTPAPAPAPADTGIADLGWDAEPFAGTRSIDVTHGPDRYVINDPPVVKALLAALRIETIQNNFGVMSEPSARLLFDRGPRGSFEVDVDSHFYCSIKGGTLSLSPQFLSLLADECSKQAHAPVKIEDFKPVPTKQRPQLTPASLKSGFKSIRLSYEIAGRGRELPITDPQDVQAFARAFNVVALTPRKHLEKKLSVWAQFTAELADGSQLYALFEDENIVSTSIGNLQLKPELQQTIVALVKKFEDREINPLQDNPPSGAERLASEKALELLRSAERVTITADDKHRPIEIAAAIPHPLKPLDFVLVRPNEPAMPAAANDLELKVFFPNGEPRTIKFLDKSTLPAEIICARPVEISGIGRAWISDKWHQLFSDYLREHRDKIDAQRTEQITARVMKDFDGFKKQVLCAQAVVTENGETLIYTVSQRDIARLLAQLKPEKVTAQQTHADGKTRPHLELKLTPGIGYDLPLTFTSDTTAEVPGWGFMEFSAPVVPGLIRMIKVAPAPVHTTPPGASPEESF